MSVCHLNPAKGRRTCRTVCIRLSAVILALVVILSAVGAEARAKVAGAAQENRREQEEPRDDAVANKNLSPLLRRHLRKPNPDGINLGFYDTVNKDSDEDEDEEEDDGGESTIHGGLGKDIVQRHPAKLTVPETKKERKKMSKESSSPPLRPHVVGGTEVPSAGSFPWFTVIVLETVDGFRYNCGGSLVAPRWVLTSAQCLLEPTPKEVDMMAALEKGDDEDYMKFKKRNSIREDLAGVLVRFFSTSDKETINAGGIPIRGLNYTIHPDVSMTLLRFNGPTNDVALVELERAVQSTELPSSLPLRPDNGEELMRLASTSSDMSFVGAGAIEQTADGENVFPTTIQQIPMTSLPPNECRVEMGDTGKFFPPSLWHGSKSALCAVSEDQEEEFGDTSTTTSTGPCTGDGGSALFVSKDTDDDGQDDELVLVGLFSLWFGQSCTRKTAPDLFTTVASVYAWIQQHVCADDERPAWCSREPRPEYVQNPSTRSSEAAPPLPDMALPPSSTLLRRRICMDSSTSRATVGKVESNQHFFGRIKNKRARRYQPCSWLRQDVVIQQRREKWCLSLMSNAASVCPITCGTVVENECDRLAAEEARAEKKQRKKQLTGRVDETDRGMAKKKEKAKRKRRRLRQQRQQQKLQ